MEKPLNDAAKCKKVIIGLFPKAELNNLKEKI